MSTLVRTQFGNPLLRKRAKAVTPSAIPSTRIQSLISDMRDMLINEKLGIGLAAPQVGKNLALAVIAIRPTEHRPTIVEFDLVLINPTIVSYDGAVTQLWEGCISAGSMGTADLFAKVPRSKKVTVNYYDETGAHQTRSFRGLQAQVVQHEVDHLNGVLFVDRVTDTHTYMTYAEYLSRIRHRSG